MTEYKNKKGFFFLFFKRFLDMFLSFLGILILSPLLIVISIIVCVSSKGPIIFKDNRIGKNGKKIKVYKFRTMYIDAETNPKKYLNDEQYAKWMFDRKVDNDPRITKIGRFLRKTSIDELPQLFNIFFGSMSIVGPRPITYNELTNEFTEEEQKILTSLRPGLTGCWQVYGRSNVEYTNGERQKLELEYYKHKGLFYDLKIILLTVPAILKQKGAK